MADSLDALKFDAIIDDKEFKASVDKIISEAQRLNTDVSKILTFNAKIKTTQIVSKASADNAAAVARHLETIEQKMNSLSGKKLLVGDADALNETLQKVLEKMDSFGEKSEKSKGSIKGINNELSKSQDLMQTLAQLTGVTFGLAGVRSFLSGLVRVTGEFEVQKMALTSMLQDAGKADEIFNTLRQRALESPYTFQDLTKYAKQLTAFNIDADKLVETEKRLADVAAGLGVDMGRIILAYGQVKAAGVLKGTELRQFTEAGVPLLQSLADQIMEVEGKAISLSEVFSRISKKQIPFEMVEEAFRRMTAEGGKFYNMQEVLVNTLQGKIGKLRDVWQQMLYDMGSSNDTLKWSVDLLTRLVSNFDKIAKMIAPLVAAWGTYKVALAACVSIQKALLGAETIAGMLKLTKATTALGTAMTAVKGAAVGLSAAAGVIALLGTAIYLVSSKMKKAREEQEKYNKAVANCTRLISDEFDNLDRLKKVAEDEKRSMVERKNAIDTINQQYGSYLSNMGQEKVSVDNLTTSYNNLREAIANKFLDELKEQTVGAERTNVNNAENALLQYNIGLIKKAVGGEPRKLARLTAEVQKYLSNIAPNSTQENIWLRLSQIYSAEGLNIDDDGAKIYKLAENYVNASERLKNSEKNFDSFADEYTKSWGTVRKTNDGVTKQDDIIPSVWGDNKGKDNKAIQKAKDDIKTVIDSIKELQRAYKDYKEMGLDDESILQIFGNKDMFGYLDKNLRTRLDFWDMLLEQAKELEKYDPNAAQEIRADVARGKADEAKKAWKDTIKATEEFNKTMEKWRNKDFNLWGDTEAERNLAKIVSDYKTKENEIESLRKKAIEEAKEAGKYTEEAAKEIDDLAAKNKEYELSLAKDKITNAAKDFYKIYSGDIDMENLSSKTRDELDNLITKIDKAKATALAAIDAISDKLKEKGFDVDALKAGVEKLFGDAKAKGEDAKTAKTYAQWQKAAKAAAKAANELAEAMGKIADATGDGSLKNLSEAIGGNASAMEAAVNGVKEYGGWWGAIIGALEHVGKLLLEDEAIWKQVEASVKRSQVDSYLSTINDILNNSKGTLGESWTMGILDAMKVMGEMRGKINDMRDVLSGQSIEKTFNSSILNPLPLETVLDNFLYKYFGFNANIFSRVNGDYKAYQDALIKGYEGAEAYIVKTHDKNGFLNWLGFDDKYSNLKDLVEGLGYDLYDENHNLNAKGLQAVLDTYTKLGEEDKAWMEEAIKYSEKYQEAMEKIKETVSDLFGNIAGTLADNMIEAFKQTGNAVDDLSKAFDNLGETFVKSMLESAIYETVLKDYQKDMETLFSEYGSGNMSYTDLLDRVNGIFDGMTSDFEKSADVYNAILDRASDLNWLGDSSSQDSSGSLGSGVKSITEDTANLLASYINAMRADLSIMRGLQERGWGYIESFGASLPTLNDYIAQIAATNFDIAQSNQSILSELRSVIGPVGTSGMVVRVEAS